MISRTDPVIKVMELTVSNGKVAQYQPHPSIASYRLQLSFSKRDNLSRFHFLHLLVSVSASSNMLAGLYYLSTPHIHPLWRNTTNPSHHPTQSRGHAVTFGVLNVQNGRTRMVCLFRQVYYLIYIINNIY